jgi:murein DD-endopeptidase MepM/ murein hydrolase activator NlpD
VRFRVSVDELSKANGISNPNQVAVNARLVIPGLSGIQGVLTTRDVSYGDTLRSLSRRYQIPTAVLVRLNHLTSPAELYAGATLVIPEQNAVVTATHRATLTSGQSLLEMAVSKGANPWTLVSANNLAGTWDALPGDMLHWPAGGESGEGTAGPGALPEAITGIALSPSPFVQGKASVIRISGQAGLTLSGSLDGRTMHFFQDTNGDYVSLHGIHVMTAPGLYTMVLTGTLPSEVSGASFSFSQAVLVKSGNYPFDPVLIVKPETIDPAVTKPEEAQWTALATPATPLKQWDGIFLSPALPPFNDCWPSKFGNRRSFNGSAYVYFHSGLDFCGGVGSEIQAPAAGTVIFAGPLTVRGNATMIDHGWGIYTGYMHQSEIKVQVGDHVEPGQIIGLVGGTGRVTGPHLHWEIWAGGVQVDPMDWLQLVFPG